MPQSVMLTLVWALVLFSLFFVHPGFISTPLPFHFQFMDRLKLLLMPLKHQPDFIYLRHVPLRRVHLFTFLQVVCLALLWILKSTVAAIIFPVMVGAVVLPSPPFALSYTPAHVSVQPLPGESVLTCRTPLM